MERILKCISWTALSVVLCTTAYGQGAGHRVTSDQVVVNSAAHWRNWAFPKGVVEISSSGALTPHQLHRDINAVRDIAAYLQARPPDGIKKAPEEITVLDGIQAGTAGNRADVVNLFDGDLGTYWQPDPPTGEGELAGQWWFSVDLGRLVIAKSIVLKFVAEALGDPFLQFDVLVSQGNKPTGSRGPSLEYTTMLRTLKPNKEQRLFEIDMDLERDFEGVGIRFVQVVVTGSNFGRGREVSQAEYDQLAAGERGEVDYFKRHANGRETLVPQEVHRQLEPDQQGSVRYYRIERPRLAELEVWAEGDEILTGALDRGGFGTASQTASINSLIDGQIESKVQFIYTYGRGSLKSPEGQVLFDLGAFYWIDAFRMAYGGSRFSNYRLDFSDGTLAADGSIKWNTAVDREQRGGGGISALGFGFYEGNNFARLKARFFRFVWKQFESTSSTGKGGATGQPAELQLYGRGFLPEVTLTSDLIRLGGSRNLLSVEWDADAPPGTSVLIQTRTGNELSETLHYFKKDGTEVSKEDYDKLLSIFRGDIVAEETAGSDWEPWSQPYEDPTGSPVTSPSPREFLTLRATLQSDDPAVSPTLRSIRLNFSNPVAQGLTGEISPFQVDQLGQEQMFSLYVRPDFGRRDMGFDQLLLVAPSDMPLRFVGLYAGAEDAFDPSADLSSLAVADVEVMQTRTDSLQLAFPPVGPSSSVEVLRLDFATALFSTGAVMRALLKNSDAGEGNWQRVDAGNALTEIESNTTTLVGAVQSTSLLTEVEVIPHVFTPNGDGVNDQAQFAFKVVRVGDDSPAEVEVFDLAGHRVRRLVEQRDLSTGTYAIGWDGRDDAGALVPPGVYYARLRIDTDTEGAGIDGEQVLKTIAVAY